DLHIGNLGGYFSHTLAEPMNNWFKCVCNKMRRFRDPGGNRSLVGGNDLFSGNSLNRVVTPRRNIYILLVGPFGCGKTELINICSGPDQTISQHEVDYRLLNTTSFDSPSCTEIDIHTRIAELLLQLASQNKHISGIIYCHSSNMALLSGTTQRSLLVLTELLLGRQNINRLTILILPSNATHKRAEEIARTILDCPTSFGEAVAGGAFTVAGGWTKQDMTKHLWRYRSMEPFCPPICHPTASQYDSPQQIVEHILGSYGRQTVEFYAQSFHQLAQDKQALEAQVTRYQVEAGQRAAHGNADPRTPSEDEYARLRQAERDYASLRSQIQLQNGYEQGAIVQHLREINDMIERLGDSISEHLVDTYGEKAFNKGTKVVTISDACDLPGLQTWLHQYPAQMHLLPGPEQQSDKRLNLSIDEFITFFVRSRFCSILSDMMFKPFHPLAEPTENLRLIDYYREIQKQEQQYTAGKWRSITFQMLRTNLRRTMEDHIEVIVQEFLGNFLEPIAEYLFGLGKVSLGGHHYGDIRRIIQKSWEWIARTKTEVIMLGDFHPTGCVPGSFDSASTMEFELSPRSPRSKHTLCTLGLGLISRKATGGGKSPDETIILKTSVLTDSYYLSS
ncbi:unnamed protein product, partial [Rhizoctonia solani]